MRSMASANMGATDRYLILLHPSPMDSRNGVQQRQLLDAAGLQPLHERDRRAHRGWRRRYTLVGAAHLHDGLGGVAEGTGGIHHVVKEDAVLAGHVADDVHHLALVGLLAALIHDGQVHMQLLGEGPGTGHGAHIRGDHHHILGLGAELLGIVVHENRVAQQVVHRDVKEALDLAGVEVHGQHTVRAGGGEHIGHQLGGDGITGSWPCDPDGHSRSRGSQR